MKKYFTLLLFLFGMYLCNAQIDFLNHPIHNIEDCGGTPMDFKTHDLDNDGDLDVIATTDDGILSWFENLNGLGNFSYKIPISDDYTPVGSSLTIRDFNFELVDYDNDGDFDIAYVIVTHSSGNPSSSTNGELVLYENLGQGNFGSKQIITTGVYNGSLAIGDFNNDGFKDILISKYEKIVWLKNTYGSGNFIEYTIYSNLPSNDFDIADVDNDGDLDILATTSKFTNPPSSSEQNIKILLFKNNNGLGNFNSAQVLYSLNFTNNYGLKYATVDFFNIDNDTDLDVLFSFTSQLYSIENSGSGNFNSALNIYNNSLISNRSFKDMDNDGDLDIVAHISSITYRYIWFENNNQSINNFSVVNHIQNPLLDYSIDKFVFADINGDNIDDLVSNGYNQYQYNSLVWVQNFDVPSNTDIHNITKKCIDSAKGIDIDNDGDLDLITSIGKWYENLDGLGNFGLQNEINIDGNDLGYIDNNFNSISNLVVAHVNNDALIDIVKDDMWYRNEGNGSFTKIQIIQNIGYTNGLKKIIDIDNDGLNDYLIAGSTSQSATIGWYKNIDGLGAFGPFQTLAIVNGTNQTIKSAYLTDINGDNISDIVFSTDGKIRGVFGLNTNGSFDTNVQIIKSFSTAGSGEPYFFCEDIDNDGDKDFLIAYSYSTTYSSFVCYINNGSGIFSNGQNFSYNYGSITNINMSDFDNDGDIDIYIDLLGSNYQKALLFENLNGTGSFSTTPLLLIKYPGGNTPNIPVDINNDGNLDIICFNGKDLTWYENSGLIKNKISGDVYLDSNNNGCDYLDYQLNNVKITNNELNSNSELSTLTVNGYYQFYLPTTGTFLTEIDSSLPTYFFATPNNYTHTFTGNQTNTTANFCLVSSQIINDVEIHIYSTIAPRPGFMCRYLIVYSNLGTTLKSGTINFQYDESKLNFYYATPSSTSTLPGTLTFNYSNLQPSSSGSVSVNFNVFAPPTVNISDQIQLNASISVTTTDDFMANNTSSINDVVVGSYDPNDIQVTEGESIFLNQINDYLHYKIRFQNTGNFSADFVRIKNVLDDNLDWDTLEIIYTSHLHSNLIKNGKEVNFFFNNINLPSINVNEINSNGHVIYRIKPKNTSQVGDVFYNSAEIYFDYNLPVITNTVSTEVINSLQTSQFDINELVLYPNPTNGKLFLEVNFEIKEINILNIYGQKISSFTNKNEIDISDFANGIYFLKIIDLNGETIIKKVIKK